MGITRPRPDGGVKKHGKEMGIARPRPYGGVKSDEFENSSHLIYLS